MDKRRSWPCSSSDEEVSEWAKIESREGREVGVGEEMASREAERDCVAGSGRRATGLRFPEGSALRMLVTAKLTMSLAGGAVPARELEEGAPDLEGWLRQNSS